MGLYTVSFGQVSQPQDLNQVVNVLQQPAGGQEKGSYYLTGWGNALDDVIGIWIPSLSRNTVPVSMAIDTSILALTNCHNLLTNNLNSSGFHASVGTTAATTSANVAGNYTIQY